MTGSSLILRNWMKLKRFDPNAKVLCPNYFCMHAKVRQGAILEIFGLLYHENELMKQIWQLCKSVILNLVHRIVQNFSNWCAFTYSMRQNSFLDSIQTLHFWKVAKMRQESVHIFNGGEPDHLLCVYTHRIILRTTISFWNKVFYNGFAYHILQFHIELVYFRSQILCGRKTCRCWLYKFQFFL